MDNDLNDYIEIVDIEKKDTYSSDEKKRILDSLNAKRLLQQKTDRKSKDYVDYNRTDKADILKELNEKRLSQQRFEEVKKRRTEKKQTFQFGMKEFYRFDHMSREFYIEINDIAKITTRPAIISLYYKVFGELKKKDFLIKIEIFSDKFFLSDDILRVYFKEYSLERERTID